MVKSVLFGNKIDYFILLKLLGSADLGRSFSRYSFIVIEG
jgi:hypothetical protein